MSNEELIRDLVTKDKQTVIKECAKLLESNKRLVKNINRVHEINAELLEKMEAMSKESERVESLSIWKFIRYKLKI